METFTNLEDAVRSLEADPDTAGHPIKRQFLCRGDGLTANLAVVEGTGGAGALHVQPHHEEVVVVLDGEVDFRVGDEVRPVQPGALVFIPRGALHGPLPAQGQRMAALSIFAPRFDPSRADNFVWERDGVPTHGTRES